MKLPERLAVFKKEINSIYTEGIRLVVGKALYKVDEKFFTAPASSTGKYHPEYTLGVGGLVRHTKAAVYIAKEIFATDIYELDQIERDYIIAALILHDTCKGGTKWTSKYTKHEHPVLVRGLLDELYLSDEDRVHWSSICNLIDTHMGKWNTNSRSTKRLPIPATPCEKLVHLCDYLASRKSIDINIFGNAYKTMEDPTKSAILSVSSDECNYHGWKAKSATKAQRGAMKKMMSKCKTLTKAEKEHITSRMNSNELLSGEASELIGIMKISIEGKATQDQINSIKDLLYTIESKSPTGLPVELSQMEWSMDVTDGLSYERAEGMIRKLKHYEMMYS